MDFWGRLRSFAEATGWYANTGAPAPLDLGPDDVQEPQSQSPVSEDSGAIFYEVHSNGPNLPVLPVEIFGMIMVHISRQDVKSLRLVSRQCEAKASTHYFRSVVVSFRSQLFDSLARGEKKILQTMSDSMLLTGGRVFDEFGPLIRRFALSLELDEEALEYPPPKPKQEIIHTFWGLYRWPYREYSRFESVSDLENDADELGEMKSALRCLRHVTSLGLCSDAGLGFLTGPDITARHNSIRHRVFLNHDCKFDGKRPGDTQFPMVTVGDALAAGNMSRAAGRVPNWKRETVKAMLQNAGFNEGQMQEAFNLLLRTENITMLADMHFDEVHTPEKMKVPGQSEQEELLAPFQALGQRVGLDSNEVMPKIAEPALMPSALTRSQKEMLLELEWAHRAMVQSYILSAIDCSREGMFRHLTTFDIAKIPSSHLHIISRHDFWTSFPALRNVSLGVVVDWRRVYVSAPGCVDDAQVSLLDAVPLTHTLIKDYISVQPKIESFHFEWICGGELAAGCHQRNQHILPAPFFASAASMGQPFISRVGADPDLLRLPCVKHLSLKNCWVAPHVLLQTLRDYALCSLETVQFEGVSLSVMPSDPQNSFPLSLVNLALGHRTYSTNTMLQQAAPSAYWDRTLTLEQPSWMSWTGLIEHFSPSVKVREVIDRRKTETGREKCAEMRRMRLDSLTHIIPDADRLPREGALYKLNSLTFKSCGYVHVSDARFRLSRMIPVTELALLVASFPMVSPFTPYMQRCKDDFMGRIIHFGMLNDRRPLLDVFGMKLGWDGVYDPKIGAAAVADGCRRFGVGRFSGTIAKGDYVEMKPRQLKRLVPYTY